LPAPGATQGLLNITLWVVQFLLAALFAFAGLNKLFGLRQEMVDNFNKIGAGEGFRYFVSALELAGATGLLIPRLSGLAPVARPHRLPLPSTLGSGRIERRRTTERPFLSDNHGASCNRDTLLENFSAELTSAAYAVALRHGTVDKWLDLELELWAALKETVKKQGQERLHFSDEQFVCDWI
jgi:DoxX-like family